MRKVLFLLAIFTLAVAVPVYAANVGGTWTLTMDSPQGEAETFDVAITQDGQNLTVSGTHPMLQAMTGTGTLKGNDINFTLNATGQMQIGIAFTGKVTGKKMEGTREIQMAAGGGGQGGPGGGQGGAAAGGGQGGPSSGGERGAAAGGGQGGPGGGQGGAAPGGGQGSPPSGGGAPAGGGQGSAPGGGQGGAPGGGGGGSNSWSAVMK